ncbi:MAG: hypothetical protein K9K76_08280 [Halanaerobiales bacterium]|nr:hypothetical protein [Halanaerobiales bacterium]
MTKPSKSKIVKAEITKRPESLFDPMPKVIVTFETGEKEELFEFYPDEIDFKENEFIGLTKNEALKLRQKKDKEFLQS